MHASFEADVISVFYEPDTTSIGGIYRATAHLPSQTHVLAECLSGKGGPRDFFIFNDRYRSSMLPLIPDFANRYAFDPQFGWDQDPESTEVIEHSTIETRTLDDVVNDPASEVPAPDYLSLDTQGTELEILEGGEKTLERNVLGVFVEVGFTPTYEGQAIFSELVAYLASRSFRLASLNVFPAQARTRERLPIGFRADGFVDSGEAFFLRDPHSGFDKMDNPDLARGKLVFIAFIHGYPHLTYELVTTLGVRSLESLVSLCPERQAYLEFLIDFAAVADEMPIVYPISYSQILQPEHSADRFSNPALVKELDPLKRLARYYDKSSPDDINKRISDLANDKLIGTEALAAKYGLIELAEQFREYRRRQVVKTKNWLGLV